MNWHKDTETIDDNELHKHWQDNIKYWYKVCWESWGTFGHAFRPSRNAILTFGRDWNGQALHKTERTRRTPHQLGPLQGWTESMQSQKGGIQRIAPPERCTACTVKIEITDLICAEEGRLLRLLIGYGKLKAVTLKDESSDLQMDNFLDSLGKVRILWKIDDNFWYR